MDWDACYACDDYVYGTAPNTFLRESAHHLAAGGRILVLADGEGRNGCWLAEQGFQVVTVDGSAVAVGKARRLAAERGVEAEILHADLADFDPGSEAWDGVVSIFCHLPPALRTTVHHRVTEALRPGGVMILEAYTPAQVGLGTGGPPDPVFCMSAAGLRRELEGLELLHLEELRRPVVEGRLHSGEGEVVQLVGRKPANGPEPD